MKTPERVNLFPRPVAAPTAVDDAIADSARLAALDYLGLLDNSALAALDRLSGLAARMLGVPIALVSLVGESNLVILGQFGFDGELAERRETPLSRTLCRHAVERGQALVIADARTEPLVQENPAIDELEIVAYAGVPLVLQDGTAVGAFCAIDHSPREWTAEQMSTLDDLAATATAILDARASLIHRGLHDRLTGLPNRELLVASCQDFLHDIAPDENVAVICTGLDHFNVVNQAFGTEKADRVLRAVAQRLTSAVRDSDVFGRLRGDVFALVAPAIHDEAEALKLAARVHRALSEMPLDIEGEPLSIGATLGVAIGGPGANGADLVSDAANAMREAKRNEGRVRVAERGQVEDAAAHLRLREALHAACRQEQIHAVFQPIFSLENRGLAGYEALARWNHPTVGPVPPDEFIPLAELTTDIIEIGELMIDRAAAFAADLHALRGEEMRVTLNASPVQLDRPGFAATVRSVFEAYGLSGRSVGIEITEGTLLESGELELANLNELRAFGARILLDDFGTGYSSFGYLREFRVDTIKIDRTFTDRLADDRHSAALVQAILAMARGMDMEVVAEGIETEEQAKLLRLLGCRFGQGFGLGRPVDAIRALAQAHYD